ncbi:MAG TPA: efflux RND transporter periplasmic adaptor subunit [Candidatus Aminicenantes bacterium]|nr:efflux RND transporter periplasmic adaptor subunit [Candidatus Aminicenantes bacterium]
MNKTLIAAATAAAVVFGLTGPACSRREDRRAFEAGPAASLEASPGGGRGPGRGAGLGPRDGRGRGLGARRAWDDATLLRLTEPEARAVDLATAEAAYRPVSSLLKATGKVLASPFRKAIVSYPFPARVAGIHVRPGDWVKAGQELVTLQSEAVGQAKSEYFKALADHELAAASFEREKRLFDRGAGAGKNLQAAEAERKVAEANLEAAEKKLHVLGFTEAQVERAAETHEINATITLFAPIAGRIVDNNVVLGAMVDQSTEILTVLDPGVVCVAADIYERDIAAVRKGQEVEVSVPAYPDLAFKGRIMYVGDILKEETRTVSVRTEVANEDHRLKPGMFATLSILLDRQARALTVPREAVLDDGDRKIVLVAKDGGFQPRIVVTGAKMNGAVEIMSGIEAGELVVTRGNYQLKSKLYDEVLKGAGVH